MKALVTGGGGFLGRQIVEQLLAQGIETSVFSRGLYPELGKVGAKLWQGDLKDEKSVARACSNTDVVFHVAAKVGMWGQWSDFYQANVTGTRNIINGCRQHGVPRLVYTSTPSVVASDQARRGVDESVPYPAHFESHYAHTKALAEQMVLQANSPELLTVSLRPHNIFGPGDTQIIPRLIARARARRLVQIGDGTNRIDMTYIDDAARAHLLAADALQQDSPVAGSAYFISQDEPVNLWQWVDEMLLQLGLPPVKRRLSVPVARTAAKIIEGTYRSLRLKGEPQLVPFLVNELALDHYYDISRAKRELGYEPLVSMAEGTRLTVAYFRDR
jgi:nucleoside-diphosphate-sugar epimerase